MIPIIRRVWAPRGKRPVALGRRRYQWLYVYGFVNPASGHVFWLLMPTVNVKAFSIALACFAKELSLGPNKRVLLVLDGAGWHKSKKLCIPEGVHLLFQPARSPEVQPSERLWPLIRESVANKSIKDLDELEKLLTSRCNYLSENPEIIHRHTLYHWWHDAEESAA